MGKPTICLRENKGADQLRSTCNCEAEQRVCFRYSSSTYIQNFKLLALFCACTGRFVSDLFGNHIVGFPTRRLISLCELVNSRCRCNRLYIIVRICSYVYGQLISDHFHIWKVN